MLQLGLITPQLLNRLPLGAASGYVDISGEAGSDVGMEKFAKVWQKFTIKYLI